MPVVRDSGFWALRIGFAAENEAVKSSIVVMNRLKIISKLTEGNLAENSAEKLIQWGGLSSRIP